MCVCMCVFILFADSCLIRTFFLNGKTFEIIFFKMKIMCDILVYRHCKVYWFDKPASAGRQASIKPVNIQVLN